MHLFNIVVDVIIFITIGVLFADGGLGTLFNPWIYIILLSAIPITIILLLLKNCFHGNKKHVINTHKYYDITESDVKRIKILAKDFLIKKKRQLNEDDYKEFFELVKENNIEVANSYATDVPYSIREILYSAYLKKLKRY